MNLLLLLSALLSAITGVNVGGARAPVAAAQIERARQVSVVATVYRAAPARPTQLLAPITALLSVTPLVRLPVVAIPAFASRRRE